MIAYILLISIAMAFASSPQIIEVPEPEPSFCPHDKSLPGLDMKRMLGKWQVVERTITIPRKGLELLKPVTGQTMTFTEHWGEYHLTHAVGRTRPKIHEYKIVLEDRKIKHYTPNEINELKLAVLVTDYSSIALIITCEQSFTYSRVTRILRRIDTEDNQKYNNHVGCNLCIACHCK